jgi:hypothetical protein
MALLRTALLPSLSFIVDLREGTTDIFKPMNN